ncbi:MAG: hypothetical protein GYB68_07000 [Chloroflexi bacterium]|nr:hypothetical protein [Chloroflexota bacterium]
MIVLNQMDRSAEIAADKISGFLRQEVSIEIPFDLMAFTALNRGSTLITLDPRRVTITRSLLDLVNLVREKFEQVRVEDDTIAESPTKRTGLFGLLGGNS